MRVLGVDAGERRIGLALSDASGLIASPLEVVAVREGDDPAALVLERAQTSGAECIVVGMPIDLRGEEGVAAQRMAAFVERLRAATELPVEVSDERMTSAVAARSMQEAGLTERDRRGQVDKVAAALILQAWLDRRRAGGEAS
ncbi:MAG TPA: Holliday junction resolvase RuvX [Armatimonadetes bacterium]|nr:Holliday junction resolvase RuvX [Armatimonadota bacterium]